MSESSVIILVADGVRPDTLDSAIASGALPALTALRGEGALHTIVTAFPSVTGAAYAPMLTGRYPGDAGLPGLRWFDRTRQLSWLLGHARSYTGIEVQHIDADLDPSAPTLFELCGEQSLGALSLITRGLAPQRRLEHGTRFHVAAALRHLRGDVAGWLTLERDLAERLVKRVRRDRPRFVFAAFPGADKAAHAGGIHSPLVADALRTVDFAAGELRRDAERDGRWRGLHLWIASDHGHAAVTAHEDLAGLVRSLGYRVRAHPWVSPLPAAVAVMASGNAMAHVYLELGRRERPFWAALRDRWEPLVAALLARPSVDLVALPLSPVAVEVRGRARGSARIVRDGDWYSHIPIDGDPLELGPFTRLCGNATLERSDDTPYPDSVVQLLSLGGAARAGDLLLSASPGWDFRSRYEPIPHRSSHGALHREHMHVPLLLNRAATGQPRRTADIFPSALKALGQAAPGALDGSSFI